MDGMDTVLRTAQCLCNGGFETSEFHELHSEYRARLWESGGQVSFNQSEQRMEVKSRG
jgi:hypothetical protein